MEDLGRLGKAILDTSPDLVIVLDRELKVVLHNTRAIALVQKAGLVSAETTTTGSQVVWGSVLQRALKGESVDFTTSVDGSSFDVSVRPVPPDLVIVHARDVTATKAAEQGRHRLLGAVPDLVAILRRDGTVVEVKEAHDRTARLRLGDIADRLEPSLAEAFRTSGPIVFEHEVVIEGEPRVREVHLRAIGADEAVLVLRDVTAQRRLTSRMMVADRMASLGTLAAGVAHELNNPLAYVINNVDFITDELGKIERTDLLAAASEAREGLARMAVVVKDLKTFSRPDEETFADVDVNRMLERVLMMAKNELKYKSHLEKTYGTVAPVRANEARLGQVFLNLIVNAAQALDERRFARNVIRVRTGMRDGRVVVEVADNGPGIPPENRARVFNPFFTTKPPGVGTGLGLAICLGIVKSMGGEIELESAVGEGAIFRVLLPATTAAAPEVDRSSFGRIPVRAPARHRILAVDDDPSMLSSLVKMLRGHDVAFAASAQEALRRYEKGDRFDLVLCDVMMPHMSGVELFEAIAKRWPGEEKRVAFMTGGAITDQTRSFLARTNAVILEKPFNLDAIQDCLQRAPGAKT